MQASHTSSTQQSQGPVTTPADSTDVENLLLAVRYQQGSKVSQMHMEILLIYFPAPSTPHYPIHDVISVEIIM